MKTKLIALTMFFLIILMPFSYAVTISGIGYGRDEKAGYLRASDRATLRVTVLGATPSPSDLTYNPLTGVPSSFDTCSNEVCILTLNEKRFESKEQTFDVQYASSIDSKETTITVYPDVVGAEVKTVSADRTRAGMDSTIKFSLSIQDTACASLGCSGKCSGIKKVIVYESSKSRKSAEIDVATDSCTANVEKTFTLSELKAKSGLNTFIFEAVDNFDNSAKNSKSVIVEVDDTAPVLASKTFSLSKDGKNISFYNAPLSNVVVSFPINEQFSSMSADLSKLNPSLSATTMECNQALCSKTINLALDTGKNSAEIKVYLTDDLGNSGTYTLTRPIKIDVTSPKIKSVSTQYPKIEDALGYGQNTTITAVVEENGVGIANANIFADFSQINPAFSSVKALSCSAERCVFPAVPIVNEGVKTVRILSSSADDLGNTLGADYAFSVIADKSLSSRIDVEYAGFEETELPNYPAAGDKLKVSVLINDATAIFAYGNFSSISDKGFIEGKCTGGSKVSGWKPTIAESYTRFSQRGIIPERFSRGYAGDTTTPSGRETSLQTGQIRCEWEVPVTKSGSIIDSSVILFFEDPFGNGMLEQVPIPNIYGLEDEVNPNYWTSEAKCSPKYLDRSAGELIEQQMYCSILLTPSTPDQQIMNIELEGCENDYVTDAVLGNANSAFPYIALTFEATEYYENLLDINCSLSITTKAGYDIMVNPETESFSIPVEFFSNPFGNPDDAIVDEIENIKSTWADGLGSMIRWLNVIQRIATRICKLMGTWQNIKQLGILSARSIPDAPVPAVGCGARIGMDVSTTAPAETARTWGNKFCDWINCQPMTQKDGGWRFGGGNGYGGFDFGYESLQNAAGGRYLDNLGVPRADYTDVKNNYIASIMTFCIPGMVQNLEKYRQIQCFYGYCLQDVGVDAGIPPSVCAKTKAYNECKFFLTPIFKLIPFVNLVDVWANRIKAAMSDPLALFGTFANYMCPTCDQVGWGACRMVNLVNVALDAYDDISGILEEFKGFNEDYCDKLDSSSRSTSSSGGRGYA